MVRNISGRFGIDGAESAYGNANSKGYGQGAFSIYTGSNISSYGAGHSSGNIFQMRFNASSGTETSNPISPYIDNEIRPANIALLPLIAF